MTASAETQKLIADELERIEEDCNHSGKAQFNAGDRWRSYHNWIGIPSTLLSVVAGISFINEVPALGGTLSVLAAILTGLVTFLKPSERAASHKGAGDQYLALRNDSRVYRQVKLRLAADDDTAVTSMDELTKRRNDLNVASPAFSDNDFKKAKAGIDAGQSTHVVDERK